MCSDNTRPTGAGGQAQPGLPVERAQPPQTAAVMAGMVDKTVRAVMMRCVGRSRTHQPSTRPNRIPWRLISPDFQPLATPDALHAVLASLPLRHPYQEGVVTMTRPAMACSVGNRFFGNPAPAHCLRGPEHRPDQGIPLSPGKPCTEACALAGHAAGTACLDKRARDVTGGATCSLMVFPVTGNGGEVARLYFQ